MTARITESELRGLSGKGRPQSRVRVPESFVVHSCIQYLWQRGIYVWRNNTGAYVQEYTRKDGSKGKSRIRFGLKGSSDIIGVMPGGRFIGVECKGTGGKQEPEQAHFQEEVERRGGLYILAYSVDDVIKALTTDQ